MSECRAYCYVEAHLSNHVLSNDTTGDNQTIQRHFVHKGLCKPYRTVDLWTCVPDKGVVCVDATPPERGTASDCQYDVKWQGRSLSKFGVALLFTFLSLKSALGSLIVPFDVCR